MKTYSQDRKGKDASREDLPPAGEATIRDVARAAAVSIATVSRYLNRSASVNPETASRVEAAMAALDYVPSTSARNLAVRKTSTLGLMMESIAGDFFASLLMGIEDEAAAAGFGILIASTARSASARAQPPIGPHNTDGAILLPGALGTDCLLRWHRLGYPMVSLFEEPPAGADLPSVRVENTAAVRAAVLHLARAHGRRRIVFVRGDEAHRDAAEREAGYRLALADAGLSFDPELCLAGDYDAGVAERSLLDLAARGMLPGRDFDAVYAADDDSSLGALRALRSLGAEVPRQVSLMGFDDQRFAALADPPLSTVRAPTEAAGRAAVRALLALLRGEAGQRTVLSTEVVFRRSCGCPGGGPRGEGTRSGTDL